MTIAEAPRALATIDHAIAELDAELERRNGDEGARRGENVARRQESFAKLLVARDKGEHVDAEDIAKAQRALEDAKLEVEANDHTVRDLIKQREDLQREQRNAQGEAMLADEQSAELGLRNARIDLAEVLADAWSKRENERAWEVRRFEVRKRGDALAEAGVPNVRRGVFVFDGSYRPHVDRLGDELEKLCNELQVNIIDGKVVAR
jgi:hypothetical protein